MKLLRSLLIVTLLTTACVHQPPTIVTPQGQRAYSADLIVQRVNELERAAIDANANKALPLETARAIVTFCVEADKTLATAPAGWPTVLSTAWAKTKAQIGTVSNPVVSVALNAVDVALAALGGAQ